MGEMRMRMMADFAADSARHAVAAAAEEEAAHREES